MHYINHGFKNRTRLVIGHTVNRSLVRSALKINRAENDTELVESVKNR